jgi:hypothetical protein
VRLIEIRLLEGPNVYRLAPVVKIELVLGRRRTWYGQRDPGRHALVRLGAAVPARAWPDGIAAIGAWLRRLRLAHGEGWARPIRRFWVHTCTLDHPDALAFYVRSGFTPYRQQIEIADDPRQTGALPRHAAPRVPIIAAD